MNVTTTKGKITAVGAVSDAKAGAVARVNDTHLTVDLQPVWLKSPNNHHRSKPLSLIVVHHTGGPAIGPALNTFLRRTAHQPTT